MTEPGAKPKRVYWDACVFLSLIEGHKDRLPTLQAILGDMDKGNVEIFTSALSITEVAFAKSEKDGKALDKSIAKKIDKLWMPQSPFRIVDVYRSITKEAKDLVRSAMAAGIPIKPADAIHLTTAKRIQADFQSYDDFKGRSADVARLCGLNVGLPTARGLLVFPPHDSPESVSEESTEPLAPKPRKRTRRS
jgi:predicted nucleic acid-binding protein